MILRDHNYYLCSKNIYIFFSSSVSSHFIYNTFQQDSRDLLTRIRRVWYREACRMSDGRSSDIRYYKRRRRLKVLMVHLPRNTLLFLTIVEIVEIASSRVGVPDVPPFPCSRHYRIFFSSTFKSCTLQARQS